MIIGILIESNQAQKRVEGSLGNFISYIHNKVPFS